MSIDWVTVLAQIANFLVLLWLLKRFLYRPILDGIDAREAQISKRMAAAEQAQQEAKAAESQYIKQRAQLVTEHDALLEKALAATEDQRDDLLAAARVKLEQEQQDWQRYLTTEREKFTAKLQRSGEQALVELTRKALIDLADETLEAAIVRHVGKRLAPLTDNLLEAAGSADIATACTQAPLPEAAKAQLTADIKQLLPQLSLRFIIDAEQAFGLILHVGGAQVAWTIDSYTDELGVQLSKHYE